VFYYHYLLHEHAGLDWIVRVRCHIGLCCVVLWKLKEWIDRENNPTPEGKGLPVRNRGALGPRTWLIT